MSGFSSNAIDHHRSMHNSGRCFSIWCAQHILELSDHHPWLISKGPGCTPGKDLWEKLKKNHQNSKTCMLLCDSQPVLPSGTLHSQKQSTQVWNLIFGMWQKQNLREICPIIWHIFFLWACAKLGEQSCQICRFFFFCYLGLSSLATLLLQPSIITSGCNGGVSVHGPGARGAVRHAVGVDAHGEGRGAV